MSQEEHKIADREGKFLQAMKGGRKLKDADWTSGRILLSNRRLVLVGNDGKRTVPLEHVDGVSGRYDVNQTVARVSEYVSLRFDDDVLLLSTGGETEQLEADLFGAMLDQRTVRVKHPAVEGGVVQDTEWEEGRLNIQPGELGIAVASGTFVEIELDDVGSVDAARRTVDGETRVVLEVEHTEAETSVQTYVSGKARYCSLLESMLRKGQEANKTAAELSRTEKQVLMALYSGVSSFEIPDFLGMDIDRVEEIFDRLIELEVLEEVRTRREVALKTRGRNIASQSINEE
jgi:helix-turn-helix protein